MGNPIHVFRIVIYDNRGENLKDFLPDEWKRVYKVRLESRIFFAHVEIVETFGIEFRRVVVIIPVKILVDAKIIVFDGFLHFFKIYGLWGGIALWLGTELFFQVITGNEFPLLDE